MTPSLNKPFIMPGELPKPLKASKPKKSRLGRRYNGKHRD